MSKDCVVYMRPVFCPREYSQIQNKCTETDPEPSSTIHRCTDLSFTSGYSCWLFACTHWDRKCIQQTVMMRRLRWLNHRCNCWNRTMAATLQIRYKNRRFHYCYPLPFGMFRKRFPQVQDVTNVAIDSPMESHPNSIQYRSRWLQETFRLRSLYTLDFDTLVQRQRSD